ncbi:MAG: nucleotidyl transferase AbiEii/AbiGii toxin family protein [Tannerellaceae bacterium]|nr:nucleotidyl transferase AbiEii/AbiGii toxin family protein [Tannerellaceae bacterium]
MDKALVEKTKKVIKSISTMETINSYILVGGTALSLQIEHRQSEDLDFMRWQNRKGEKMDINISGIKKELSEKHTIDSINILEFNHIEIYIDGGVKLSFYAPERRSPSIKSVPYLNNMKLADTDTIASLKMEIMMRRTMFRDYYDIYCILKDKNADEIKKIIDNALKYSGHRLKSKNLIGMLVHSERFRNDSDFNHLQPKYDLSAKEIETFMIEKVKALYN